VPEVVEFIDILEVGTPILKRFGLAGIFTLRELGPGRPVLADTKTVDGGAEEAKMVFGAGATFMTVLSCASGSTHDAVNHVAGEHGAHVVVDTLCGATLPDRPSAYPDRFAFLGLHASADERRTGVNRTDHIKAIKVMHEKGYSVSIAGGIGLDNLAMVIEAEPEIVVVGSAITSAKNPRSVAQEISSQLINRGLGWPRV
jgi:3-hexulose-6-phosphate synthase